MSKLGTQTEVWTSTNIGKFSGELRAQEMWCLVSWHEPNRAGEGETGGTSKLHIPTLTPVALAVPAEGNVRIDRVSERQVT